jgi:hypothetical protein
VILRGFGFWFFCLFLPSFLSAGKAFKELMEKLGKARLLRTTSTKERMQDALTQERNPVLGLLSR